jgi:hypothetical protein
MKIEWDMVLLKAFIVLMVPLMITGIGLMTQMSSYSEKSCDTPWRRIEYISPWYRLGCWLGAKVEK